MNAMFQKIEPKRAGLPCEVQVINMQGHGVLTTYDQTALETVDDAFGELVDFWDSCNESYKRSGGGGLSPKVWGRTPDQSEPYPVDVKAPEFDLADYVQLTIMPGPLAGG